MNQESDVGKTAPPSLIFCGSEEEEDWNHVERSDREDWSGTFEVLLVGSDEADPAKAPSEKNLDFPSHESNGEHSSWLELSSELGCSVTSERLDWDVISSKGRSVISLLPASEDGEEPTPGKASVMSLHSICLRSVLTLESIETIHPSPKPHHKATYLEVLLRGLAAVVEVKQEPQESKGWKLETLPFVQSKLAEEGEASDEYTKVHIVKGEASEENNEVHNVKGNDEHINSAVVQRRIGWKRRIKSKKKWWSHIPLSAVLEDG